MDNLSELNALEVFNVGHRHEVEEMKKTAFQIIKKEFGMTDSFIDQPDLVNEIVTAVKNADKKECYS